MVVVVGRDSIVQLGGSCLPVRQAVRSKAYRSGSTLAAVIHVSKRRIFDPALQYPARGVDCRLIDKIIIMSNERMGIYRGLCRSGKVAAYNIFIVIAKTNESACVACTAFRLGARNFGKGIAARPDSRC